MSTLVINDFLNDSIKSNFTFSFAFLPKNKREAINLVYNWCRVSDNIVDSEISSDNKKIFLYSWIKEFEKGLLQKSQFPILNKLSVIINNFNIPTEYFLDLLKGMEMDLTKTSYKNFEELDLYCYRVAGTVGLICAEIFGYKNKSMMQYSVTLGKALQLTNILRDVKQDAKKGRIYIPQDEMQKFNLTEKDLLQTRISENMSACFEYQWNRALFYFTESDKFFVKEESKNFIAAKIMKEIYYSILLKIKTENYDVFSKNIKISAINKFSTALVCWWKNR